MSTESESRRAAAVSRLEALHRESEIELLYMSQAVDAHGEPVGRPSVSNMWPPNEEWPGNKCLSLWQESCDLVDARFDVDDADGGLSSWLFSHSQQFWSQTGIRAVLSDPLREWLDALRNPNQGESCVACALIVTSNPLMARPMDFVAIADKAQLLAKVLRDQHNESEKLRQRIDSHRSYLLRRSDHSTESNEMFAADLKVQCRTLREYERTWRHWTGYADIVSHYASALLPDELAKCREMSRRAWERPQEANWDELERELDLMAHRFQWLKPTQETSPNIPPAVRHQWDILGDGLDPIIESLEGFDNAVYARAKSLEWLHHSSHSLGRLFADVWNETINLETGRVQRREAVRVWLQQHDLAAVASEVDERRRNLIESLRTWQEQARPTVEWNEDTISVSKQIPNSGGDEWPESEKPKLIDYLGEDHADSLRGICGNVAELVDYLKMQRSEVARRLAANQQSGKTTPPAAPKGEGTPVNDAQQPARSVFDRLKAKPGEKRLGDLSPNERENLFAPFWAAMKLQEEEWLAWRRSHSLPDDEREALRIVLNDIETDIDPTLLDDVPLDNCRNVITAAVKRERWKARLMVDAAERLNSTPPAAPSSGAKPVKRRFPKHRKSSTESNLTAKQLEAMQIVGECKGDIAEAARRLGKDRSTIKQHYDAATAKLGKRPVKHSTEQHATDRRGQANIATDADKRL